MCWLSVSIDLTRFDNFKGAEFRSLEILSPIEINATFAVQDQARSYDWITMTLKFSGVSDAHLVDGNKISYVDLSDGISIIKEDRFIAFGIGKCYNVDTIKNSSCYIIATSFKYEEGNFE